MNTLRNELKEKYSQIPNELITDLSLCSGSLRVLLYLFTKPDNWNVYNKDICKQLNISEQTLTKYWKTLLSSKWLKREPSRNKEGHLTGGYTYRIGNFTVSIQSTETVKSIGHSNNKLINKEETNKTKIKKSVYEDFLEQLSKVCKYKTKVIKTKEGLKAFNLIEDKQQLFKDYKQHQEEKDNYAVVITKFMIDYDTVYKQENTTQKWN